MRSHEILDFCDLRSVPQSIFEITVAIIILVLRYVCTIGKLFIGIDPVHVSGKDSSAIINCTAIIHNLSAGISFSSYSIQSLLRLSLVT